MDILGLVSVPGWLVALLALLMTVYIYGRHKHNYFRSIGVQSMRTTFMLGDIPIVMKQGFNYISADLVKEHGKVFGIYMGNKPSLVVCDADMIKEITVKQFNKFINRNMFGPFHERWRSSLTLSVGDHWKFLRSSLSPSFSSGKLRNLSPILEMCLKNLHSSINENILEHPDGFDIAPLFNGLTMDVICNTGFGMEVNAQTDQNNTFVQHAKKLLEAPFSTLPVVLLSSLFPDLDFVFKLFPTNFISMTTYEYLKAATQSAIAARKEEGPSRKDILQMMINAHKVDAEISNENEETYEDFKKRGLTDEEVLINSIAFFSAGYDTTASALAWCVYDLVTHPEVQDRLIQEIDAGLGEEFPNYDNVAKLKYLDMVMNETLRMHPPAGRFNRRVNEDTEINGVQFKKGSAVTFSPLAMHYLPEYWEKPEEYNPDRFAPENKDKINPYAFMPFGQGPRHCLAMRLAHVEIKMTIASILQKYRLVKTGELQIPMPLTSSVIMRPAKAVVVKATPRSQ